MTATAPATAISGKPDFALETTIKCSVDRLWSVLTESCACAALPFRGLHLENDPEAGRSIRPSFP